MSSVKDKNHKSRLSPSKLEKKRGDTQAPLHVDHILSSLRDKAQKPQKLLTPQKGVQKGWRKVTTLMRNEHHMKLQELSHSERVQMKDILDEVLARFLSAVHH